MDFNFFEPYLNVPVKSNARRNFLILLFILAVGLMAYYQWLLLEESKSLRSEISEIDAYIQSEEVQTRREGVLSKQNYEQALLSTYNSMKAIDQQIDAVNAVHVELIEKINAEIPAEVFLSNLQIVNGAVSFTGYASNYDSLSQFVYNVRSLDEMDQLSIPTVNELEENFSFSVNGLLLKEGPNEN